MFTFKILKSIENERNKENTTIKTTLNSELSLFHSYFGFLTQMIAIILFCSEKRGADQGLNRGAIAFPNILQNVIVNYPSKAFYIA